MSAVTPALQHEHISHRPPPGAKRSVWIRAGWWRALLWTWTARGLGIALPGDHPLDARLGLVLAAGDVHERAVPDADRLPPRHRLLRLLGPLMIGSPTRPEDHADHGAYRWQDTSRSTPITR